MNAEKREVGWFIALAVMSLVALMNYMELRHYKGRVLELRDTMRNFMVPKVQALPSLPQETIIAKTSCYSRPDCRAEKSGWVWAARNNAVQSADCTLSGLPIDVRTGCTAYLEALGYPVD